MKPGNHGSTFGGNPLMCATASTVVDTIKSEMLMNNAEQLGAHMLKRFTDNLKKVKGVRVVRGKGLMIGIELDNDCTELTKLALEKHLLINVTGGKVIRLLPALIINQQQADEIVDTVSNLVITYLQKATA
jgi:acetylornithine aminotransferase